MNRIVRENYPVADLPEDLRDGLASGSQVQIVIEERVAVSDLPRSFKDLFVPRQPSYRSMDDIVAEVRRDRDSWDD